MTKEEFIERMTGVKPEDQPLIERLEEIADRLIDIKMSLDVIAQMLDK